MASTAYIALGSNLASKAGDPEENLRHALRRLETLGRIAAVSSIYETEPVGDHNQPWFMNSVAAMATGLEPARLMARMLAIEQEFGRRRDPARPKGPRILDLDLLMVDDVVITTPELSLPHPAMARRRFVLAPLAEIAPRLRHPVLNRTMEELLQSLPDDGETRRSGVRNIHRFPWPSQAC